MRQATKDAVRDITPPLIWRGVEAIFSTRRGTHYAATEAGEKDADWYDATFERSEQSRGHYSQSPYYSLWTVTAAPHIDGAIAVGAGDRLWHWTAGLTDQRQENPEVSWLRLQF